MRWMLLLSLLLSACVTTGGGRLEDSGEVAPAPVAHAKLCAKDPTFPNCPKAKP